MSTTRTTQLTPIQEKAIRAVQALRELTRRQGIITTKAQNTILQALTPQDLAAVAIANITPPIGGTLIIENVDCIGGAPNVIVGS